MLYCPKCFGNHLKLAPRGVVHISINNKHMQSSQFLFNTVKDDEKVIANNIREKFDEFMNWYSSFQNKDPIKDVQLSSSDFVCENGCKVSISSRYNIINILISQEIVMKILNEVAYSYNIRVEVDPSKNF
ncbi:MAG: hypothetical protein KAQ98_12930 [Bacteriovoracaceae bacterium]|nr:hypothetical protein [Bacteriovoracaceae bacterium]